MEPLVFGAVLAAAALHAGWNAIVKNGLDQFLSVMLIAIAAGIISIFALPLVELPRAEAWPWLVASTFLHLGYSMFLVKAYRVGDLGQVYPVARGAAPLFVTIVAVTFLGEEVGVAGLAGIGLLIAGIWLMSIRGSRDLARLEGRPIVYALATSFFIASYTIADGLGARANGSPHGYTVWLFLLNGLMMLGVLIAMRGPRGLHALRPYWRGGLAGGTMSAGAYWIAIWAMTTAPIALVAALRETSVLFAAAISVLILGEPLTKWRVIAAILILAGVVVTRTA